MERGLFNWLGSSSVFNLNIIYHKLSHSLQFHSVYDFIYSVSSVSGLLSNIPLISLFSPKSGHDSENYYETITRTLPPSSFEL